MNASGFKGLQAIQSEKVIDSSQREDPLVQPEDPLVQPEDPPVSTITPVKRNLKVISHKEKPLLFKSTGLKENLFVEKPMLSSKSSNRPTEGDVHHMT